MKADKTMTPHGVADALEGVFDGHRIAEYLFMRYPVLPRSAEGTSIKGRSSALGVMCLLAGANPDDLQSKRRLEELDRLLYWEFRLMFPWATPEVRRDLHALAAGMPSTDASFGPVVSYLRLFPKEG